MKKLLFASSLIVISSGIIATDKEKLEELVKKSKNKVQQISDLKSGGFLEMFPTTQKEIKQCQDLNKLLSDANDIKDQILRMLQSNPDLTKDYAKFARAQD